MLNHGSILGSTFFASREPVRNALTLKLIKACQDMGAMEPALMGSLGYRLVRGFLLTSDGNLHNMREGDIVEVTDYDPVRKTSLIIGLREPSKFVPLHWLGIQTHPDKLVTLFLFVDPAPPGVNIFSSKLLHGSFEEAMEVAKVLKASKKDAIFIDGGGLFMVSKNLETILKDFKALLEKAKEETPPEGKAPSKEKKPKRKDRA
jgi:hypothetical protein